MITRENYEEYFLVYIDNELPVAGREAVETFLAQNPDLKEELESLLQCRVDPNPEEVFYDKPVLLQQDLLSYIDNELDEAGRREVEQFVGRYPSKAVELQQLLLTVIHPDLSVVFPDKESLYRKERDPKIVFLPWIRAGIAAAVLLIAALLLLLPHGKTTDRSVADRTKKQPAVVTPAPAAPLYLQGSDDRHEGQSIAANDSVAGGAASDDATASKTKEQRKAMHPAPEKKDIGPDTMPESPATQELAQTRVTPPVSDSRPSEPVAVVQPAHIVDEKGVKPTTATADVAVNIPKEQSSFATQALLEEAQADESKEMMASAPAGKNKLRGIFRRVTRAFGKTAERDSDGQKEVLISAFQVALK